MQSNKRNIIDVHNEIIKIIPDYDFKIELQTYIDSLWNQAPECLIGGTPWILYANILVKYIPNFSEDEPEWKFKVRDIYNGV
jgi:hypothetical protein